MLIGEALGPYRIESELGSGGMGKVYAATVEGHCPGLDDGAKVAVKLVHPHLLEQPGFFRRFLREAEIGASVRHANVVRTHLADALGAHHFLVMEYVEGQTLRDLLVELDRVPEELCRHIGREVAKGLAAIHAAGVVHRDLKPENVLITEDHVVKVMDLGVARLQDESIRLSQSGAFVGSVEYAAPEQFRGPDTDHRADLHALGLLLYELSCGQHPYRGDDFRAVIRNVLDTEPRRLGDANPQLSAFFEELVHTLLAKDREQRFATAAELVRILEAGEASEWWIGRATALRTETHRPLRRMRIERETAIYGRDGELAKLHALYERARSGDGSVLLIEGEAGVGKTRLVDEFVGRLRQEGEDLNFLFGSYPPTGAATAAGAFSTVFREHLGPAGSAPYLTETPLLVPAFDAVLHGDAAPKDAEPLTKDSLGTCFVHATRALAAERTTVLLIDDLHFAPEDARGLFTSLALAVPGHRVLLIGTMRPGVPEEWVANLSRLEHGGRATLPRLGPKDLALLLEESFRSQRLAQELGHQIAVKSDGNPFFAFEIIQGLRDGQFISRDPDGTWVSTRVIEDIQIPSSVMDLIQARIADLSEEERDLLDVASCCGFEFDPLLVAAALGIPQIPAMKRLARIEKTHRLVRSVGRRCMFDHHQVQEALYGGLPELLREPYHAALAGALETRAGAAGKDPKELPGALCVDLCRHSFKGASGERAVRYLDAALDHLRAGYLNDQVIALATRALAVPGLVTGEKRVELLFRKATPLGLLGRRKAERAALDEALTLAEADGAPALRARAEIGLAGHLLSITRYEEGHDVLARALERAREAGETTIEAQALQAIGAAFCSQGRYEEARERHERCLVLSRELGDRQAEATAMGSLGLVFWSQGRYEEAREHYERQLALTREIGDRGGEAQAMGGLGLVCWSHGRNEEAREHFERWLAFARETGNRRSEATATGNLGNVLWNLGRNEAAREHYDRNLVLAREIGDRAGEARVKVNLGRVLWSQGRSEDACEQLERLLTLASEIGYRQGEAIALVNLGQFFVELGTPDAGRERLREALALCREIGERRVEGYALHRLGAAAEGLGEVETAARLYGESLALRREIGYPTGVATTLVALGALLATTGREEEAVALLTEADATAREVGVLGAQVLSRCHLALLPGGDVGAARRAFDEVGERLELRERMEARFLLWRGASDPADLAEAHRLLVFLREHAGEEYRTSILENVPLHRDIVAAWKEHGS